MQAICLSTLSALACILGLNEPALADVIGPGGRSVDCYCTDRSGARVELGQTICLQVDGRMFMAQCQMSLNVPMWRRVSDGCAVSANDPLTGLQSLKPS